MYKNSEGYGLPAATSKCLKHFGAPTEPAGETSDPTAGAALSQIMKEYRQQRREKWRRENEIKSRPKVYVVSKYAGDVEQNVRSAICYCKYAISQGKMPIASHLLYPQMLNDNDPTEREIGTMFGLALLDICNEVWVFGKEHSAGMKREIVEAKRLGKSIKYFDSEVI